MTTRTVTFARIRNWPRSLRMPLFRLLPIGFAVVGIGLSVTLGHLDVQRQESELMGNASARLSGLRAGLEAQLRTAFGETEGIAQLISTDGTITPEHFHDMARQAIASVPYIRHIAVAPADVVADVFPLEGNQRILGLDYRTLPTQYPMLQRAQENHRAVLAGPIDLYQGGRGLIYRRPVFVGGLSSNPYWGNLSIVADTDRLLNAAGLDQDGAFELALRGVDGRGEDGAIIWGQAELFSEPGVTLNVDVPGGHWQLAATPHGGWPRMSLFASPLFLFSLACTGVFCLFVAQLIRSNQVIHQRNDALRLSQAQLEQSAHYDVVTGLPNRLLFQQRLETAISSGERLGVLVLDIDGFKLVNDSLGHPLGDLLLQQTTQRFVSLLTAQDTACRLGGDEFAFVLSCPQDEQVMAQVQGLLLAMQQPFDLKGTAALVTGSIGVAFYPDHGHTSDSLLRHADTAMYAAKEGGRNTYRTYHPDMTLQLQQRIFLEGALRRALQQNEFELWYQPKIDLFSGRVEGAEALLRWRDPEQGLVSPADFIPLAERTGLIIPLGEKVLDLACAQLACWRARECLPGPLAINVAALQIERSDFVESLSRALRRYDLPATLLEVEITESLLMESPQHACAILSQLQQMGVATAVDDFGTGYSSLAYLKVLPIDHLKIDRTFIKDLPGDDDGVAITQSIIDLGHALGFRITAEGIETHAQHAFLRNAGCDQGQGYLIGRPMPADSFERWLAEQPHSQQPMLL